MLIVVIAPKCDILIMLIIYSCRYFYQGYTDDMTQEVQRAEIERSLKEWADVANVNFYEVHYKTMFLPFF